MKNIVPAALFIASLIVPIVLFWWLRTRSRVKSLIAAAITIAIGWGLNLAWASVAGNELSNGDMDTMAIATKFGWFCPTFLVAVTWVAYRIKNRHDA